MPITVSAKKALRAAEAKRVFNVRRIDAMKKTIKKFQKLVVEKKLDEAKKLFAEVQQSIDKAVKRGVIKPNAGARKKSRLTAFLKKNS